MADDTLVPFFSIEASQVGERRYYDAWRETVRPVYDVEPTSDATSRLEGVRCWLVNQLIFSDVTISPQSFHHHSRHVSREDSNYLSLQIYRYGSARGVNADQPFAVVPDEVHIFDFSREFRSVTRASGVAGVIIPHQAVGYSPGKHPAHLRFDIRSPAGRFLAQAFFSVMNQLPELRQGASRLLADGFCGLISGLLVPEADGETRSQKHRADRYDAMRTYLDAHLNDPDLGIEELCEKFGASRPSVYRYFAGVGGVAHYITQRRLDRTLHQLMSGPASRGRVHEIARRWGFDDPAHFSKLFRRRFGVAPSAAMNMGSSRNGTDRPPRGSRTFDPRLGDWLQAI